MIPTSAPGVRGIFADFPVRNEYNPLDAIAATATPRPARFSSTGRPSGEGAGRIERPPGHRSDLRDAAVDFEFDAVDVFAFARSQEHRGLAEIRGGAETAERNGRRNVSFGPFRQQTLQTGR